MFDLIGTYAKRHVAGLVTILAFLVVQVVCQTYLFMGTMKRVVLD